MRAALASQLADAISGEVSALSALPGGEAVVSLLPNDGGGWCECDACALSVSDNTGGTGGRVGSVPTGGPGPATAWRMYKGVPLMPMEQSQATNPPTVAVRDLGTLPNFGFYSPTTRTGVTATFRVPQQLHAEFSLTLTQADLAALGIIVTGRQWDNHSRRYVDLVREVAEVFQRENLPMFRSDPEVWFTIGAYYTWRGAPVFQGNAERVFGVDLSGRPFPQETRLPENVIVYVTGVRDLTEYDPSALWSSNIVRNWHQMTERFNFRRWSVIANVTGIYEYLLDGTSYALPRLYTRRLGNALVDGYNHKARTFVGESTPCWSLDGPKWFELASLLWNLGRDHLPKPIVVDAAYLAEIRRSFADAMATPTDDSPNRVPDQALSDKLVRFYDAVEENWTRTVDAVVPGYRGSWELGLTVLTSKIRQFDTLDPVGTGFDDDIDLARRVRELRSDIGSAPPSVQRRLEFLVRPWPILEFLARITRRARYVARYIRTVNDSTFFAETWVESGLGAPPSMDKPLMLRALTDLDRWVGNPMAFREEVRGVLNARLIEAGALRAVGAGFDLPVQPVGSLDDVQFVFDLREMNAYKAAWGEGESSRFDLYNLEGIDREGGLYGRLVGDLKSTVYSISLAVGAAMVTPPPPSFRFVVNRQDLWGAILDADRRRAFLREA